MTGPGGAVTGAAWSAVTVDCLDPVRVGAFWSALLGLETGDAMPGWVRLGGRGPGQLVLNFQPVPEAKQGKNRVHLDVTVDDIDRGVRRVVDLGGSGPHERHDYPGEGVVVVAADPEGNEFCLVQYVDGPASAGS